MEIGQIRSSTTRRARSRAALLVFTGLVLSVSEIALASPAIAAELTIRLCGMQTRRGGLRITVFERAQAGEFTNAESKAFAADLTERLEGKDWGPVGVVVPLPPGDYAVRVIHDENSNGILDRDGWLTTPTESYGYSRGVRARVSAVEFEEAFVTLGENPLSIDIRVAPWSLTSEDPAPCPK